MILSPLMALLDPYVIPVYLIFDFNPIKELDVIKDFPDDTNWIEITAVSSIILLISLLVSWVIFTTFKIIKFVKKKLPKLIDALSPTGGAWIKQIRFKKK